MKKYVLQRETSRRDSSTYRIPYRDLLNEQQYEAVMHDYGPALVIAGAGTGKTRTLIYRLARLVEDGTAPSSILLLTFTRRAARGMLDRAAGVLDDRCTQVRGGTFHHYCNQLLHQYADRLGFSSKFTLLDQADAHDSIHHIRSTLAQNLRGQRFPQKQTLAAMFSVAVNKQMSLFEVIASDFPRFLQHHEVIDELRKRYSDYKRENDVMDFDDLLVETRRLLLQEGEIRERVASNNRFVMVDEYQDTNNLQAELASLFSSVHHNLMVVGDDAQSIYAFRGANFRNILAFPKLNANCKIIKLEENYRSTQPILDLSNNLINKANEKFEKRFDDHTKRMKDLDAFSGLANGFSSLEQMLQELTLEPLDATAVETEAASRDEDPLTLSTIHSSKGLEWDTVFVIQCLDGVIPSGYSIDDPTALDEELRLLYVACSRAREKLFITYPVTGESTFGEFFSNPSRFLNNLPEDILEPWMIMDEFDKKQLNE